MPFKSEKQRRYLFANEPEVAKKFAKDYNMGGVASMFRKRLADGDDPFYDAWKKIYETNPDAASMNENHDQYLEKYTLEMSTQTSEAPTEDVEQPADPMLNLFSETDALNNNQALTTLFAKEEPQGIMAAANGGFAMQGGVRNYLGETDTVSEVPIKWKSAPDHPETELAYITKKEKDLLLKKDLHNSLDGSPNKGPEGLISLNGGGYGSENAGTGGSDGFGGSDDNSNDYTGSDFGFVASQPTTTAEFNEGPTADPDALDMQDYLTDYVTVNEKKQKQKEYDDLPSAKKDMIKVKQDQAYKGRIKNVITDIKNNPSIEKRIADKMVNYVVEKALLSNPYTAIAYGLAKVFGWKPSNSLVKTDISGNVIGKNEVTPSELGFYQGPEYDDFWQGGPDEDDGGSDAPIVDLITGEVNEDVATGQIDLMSALDKIRANQARRSGLVANEIIQDNNQIMTANKGGLAGLFKVKTQ